jgi:hypothetical protein
LGGSGMPLASLIPTSRIPTSEYEEWTPRLIETDGEDSCKQRHQKSLVCKLVNSL